MKLYLVYRIDNNQGYDEYDSWVVMANTAHQAKSLCKWGDWDMKPKYVVAKQIKIEGKPRTILGSFNAG